MSSKIKYCLLFAALFSLSIVSQSHFNKKYHLAADRFDVQHIRATINLDPFQNCCHPSFTSEAACQLFDRPFRYLAKGCQFFVFESEDHQYVLKFFKQHRLKKKPMWIAKLLFPFLAESWEEKNAMRNKEAKSLFEGAILAYQNLPEETGVLAIQLNKKGPFHQTVLLVDKLGVPHRVDVDRHPFILQKKISTSASVLKKIAAQNDGEKITSALRNILLAIESRCKKGIVDNDTAVLQNLGFTDDGKAIFIDFSHYVKDETINDFQKMQEDKKLRLEKIKEWAENECPQLVTYVDKMLIELNIAYEACVSANS